jgi:hypothetical protein
MKPVVLVLGALGLLVAGGGAALLLTGGLTSGLPGGQHTAPPPPAQAAQSPAPEAPPPSAAPPASEAASTPPPPPPSQPLPTPISFVPLVQDFSLVRDSAAFVAADQNAPQLYPLRAGTPLVSAARSPDGAWTVAMTADGRAAFIPSADIGPYDPHAAPLPEAVSGPADVLDTGTLVVDGQTVPLAGLIGHKGDLADKMQNAIKAKGPEVSCTLQQGGAYICTLPSGEDIGRSALYNGAAEVTNDASADYHAQADAARDAHRGIWQ